VKGNSFCSLRYLELKPNFSFHFKIKRKAVEYLSEENLKTSPFEQFDIWYKVTYQSDIQEPTAVMLATCNKDLKPSSRTVLMKDYSEEGFMFFTNYDSRKGIELITNPNAAMLFYWGILDRQIRIEGTVKKVSESLSDQYFDSRPKRSRISAIVSDQSQKVEKKTLDEEVRQLNQKYESTDKVPRPANWGGFILQPTYFEFWQGKTDRLHDRFVYEKQIDNSWQNYRIAP